MEAYLCMVCDGDSLNALIRNGLQYGEHSATLDNPPISYSFGPLYLASFILYLLVWVWVLDASLRIGLFQTRCFGMPKARLLQPKPVLYIGLSFTGIARVRLSVMISVKYDVIYEQGRCWR